MEEEEAFFNASSSRGENNNTKDEDEFAFEEDDQLTSDDDYSGDDDQEEDREERCRSILKNEFGNQRERVMRRDARKWQKMNAKKMRGRGDLGKATRKKNTIIIACPPVLPPHVDATQQVRGVNCGNIGPELEKLRFEQGENREYYTKEHFDRLYGRARAWNRDQRANKVWCKDIHPAGVTCNECTTCHFCRQKSSDAKTTCQCATWAKAPEGGRGRGSWCGWCLEMRMGENIE